MTVGSDLNRVAWLGLSQGVGGQARYVSTLRDPVERALRARDAELVERLITGRVPSAILRRAWAYAGGPTFLGRAGSVDVVHVLDDIAVPRIRGVPTVVTCHDLSALIRPELVGPRLTALKRASYRRAGSWAGAIVPSDATAEDLRPLMAGDIRVIRYAVGEVWRSDPTPLAIERMRSRTGDAPYVVVVGPVSLKKGSDILRRAWERTRGQTPHATLVWVTSGRHEIRLDLADSAGSPRSSWRRSEQGIIEVTEVSDEDLRALVAAAAAAVVPSRYEGFSYPIVEAASQGTPVIASDIGPHREFDFPGLSLVPTEDDVALGQAIAAALTRPQRHAPVRDARTMDDVAEETAAFYESIAVDR